MASMTIFKLSKWPLLSLSQDGLRPILITFDVEMQKELASAKILNVGKKW